MATDTLCLVARGDTQYGPSGTIDTGDYGSSVGVEGSLSVFNYVDPSNKTRGDNRKVEAIFVRNTSGRVLLPGRAVTWESGYRDKRVDDYSFVSAEAIAGIVDDLLPAAGVRIGDMFWLITKGPTRGYISTDGTSPAKSTPAFVIDELLIAGYASDADQANSGKLSTLYGTWLAETNGSNELVTNVARNGVGRATQTTAVGDTGLRKITVNIRP